MIDDFGRQKVTPAEVLNRWVVPMERRIDYLTFRTGGKAQVPFECFLVFSTNLRPEQLGDEAFLRRLQYKMFVRSPEMPEFCAIFRKFCQGQKIECDDDTLETYIDRHYLSTGRRFRRCQARDVISHAVDRSFFVRTSKKFPASSISTSVSGIAARMASTAA